MKILKYTVLTLIILATTSYIIYKIHEYHEVIELALSEPLKITCDNNLATGIGKISGTKHHIVTDDNEPAECYKSDDSDSQDDAPSPPIHKDEVTL